MFYLAVSPLYCRVIPDKELCSSARNETDTAVTDDGGRETLTAATHAATTGIPLPLAPEPLPVQVIERNRLSMAEIRALPRFRDYSPGTPSKVIPYFWLKTSANPAILTCITEIFSGTNFRPCSKDHHRLYAIIDMGQKNSLDKNFTHESGR